MFQEISSLKANKIPSFCALLMLSFVRFFTSALDSISPLQGVCISSLICGFACQGCRRGSAVPLNL